MKKLILSAAILLGSLSTFAQTSVPVKTATTTTQATTQATLPGTYTEITAEEVPEAVEFHGRAAPSERSEGGSAHLFGHVADGCAAAQSEAGDVQHGRVGSGDRAAHEAVLPAAIAGAVDRRGDGVPVAHGHDFLQLGRAADSGGKQSAPDL